MCNQGAVGKCNSTAAVGAMFRLRDQNGHKHVPLADNDLYIRINDGVDQGSMLDDGMEACANDGVAPRFVELNGQDYEIPHLSYRTNHLRRGAWEVAGQQRSRFRTHEPIRLPTCSNFARAVASCLARDWPIVMAWHVGGSSNRLLSGYIQQGRGPGNHASFWHSAKFVGGQDIVHPDLCNSWGPTENEVYGPRQGSWGDGGYGLMTMESAAYCRRNHVFYVLTGVTEDLGVAV